jgi:phage terminase large subunit-like protein
VAKTGSGERGAGNGAPPAGGGAYVDDAFYFDERAADGAVRFFERVLRHTKGEWAGRPFVLEGWQREEVIRPLFGWKRREDGRRRYKYAFLEWPRKTGKSTIGSGIALYLLTADGEGGAEVYSAAADRAQASIVFDQAQAFVMESPLLAKEGVRPYKREIRAPAHSRYQVLSADAFTKHGLNPHGVLFDELHAQPGRELFDVLRTGMGARRQPLFVMITTAGYDMNSICFEQYEYAKQVQAGIVDDPEYFVHITEAEREEDWTDPAVWRKANRNLGVTVLEQFYAAECRRALASPASQNAFRQLYLNQWVSQESRWLDMGAWMECATPLPELEGRPCYLGLDLASVSDVAAWVAVYPPEEGDEEGLWWIEPHFYVPGDNLVERGQLNRAPYGLWVQQGHLTATTGNVIDYGRIEADILAFAERHPVRQVGVDTWNAQQMAQNLMAQGLETWAVRQTFAGLSFATKGLERLVLGGQVGHGGHPVLRWMVDNVTVVRDAAENIKPDKKRSRNKIDGVVATVMALDRALRQEGTGPSVYEERGLLQI